MLLMLSLTGCVSSSLIQGTKTTSATVFYPENAWRNPANNRFIISGYRTPNASDRVACYIDIPPAIIQKLSNDQNQIILSRCVYLSQDDTLSLDVRDGGVPSDYVSVPTKRVQGVVVSVARKTEYHPSTMLALPATVVLDVVTLPIQIPAAKSLSKIQ